MNREWYDARKCRKSMVKADYKMSSMDRIIDASPLAGGLRGSACVGLPKEKKESRLKAVCLGEKRFCGSSCRSMNLIPAIDGKLPRELLAISWSLGDMRTSSSGKIAEK